MTKATLEKKHQLRKTLAKRSTDYWSTEEAKGKLIVSLEYPGDVDQELIPLLDLLNSVPGIRTLFSCCGHSRESFYMVLAFTSVQARSLIENCFQSIKNLGPKIADYREDCFPHARFTIEDFYTNNVDSLIFENSVGFYSQELGMKKKAERVKDYKRMCKFIMKLVPRKHW
jgi:hypothetical protein